MTPKQWKRIFLRIVVWCCIILAVAFLGLMVRTVWHAYGTEREARGAHLDEQEAYDDLAARKASLSSEIHSLDTSRGVEAEVRDRYPLAKTGEEVIVLTDAPSETSSTPPKAPQSIWELIVSWF